MFGDSVAVGSNLQTAGPPLKWFAVALGLAVLGLMVAAIGALLSGSLATAVAGWLLAGPAAIGALAPKQKVMLSRLGFKALVAGALASLFSAVIVGVILG